VADNKPKIAKKAAKAQETPAGHNLTAETASIPESTGEKRKPIPPVEHQFKPGNPGRPKGARNKLGEAFLEAMLADFTEHGVSVIQKVRLEKPDVYLKTVASILPQQVNVKVEPFEDMTDDQLRKHAERLLTELGPIAAFASGGSSISPEQAPTGKPLN
jgi:hypothetical protein